MAGASTPYGLIPVQRDGGRYVGVRRAYVLTTNNTTGIFLGDPVHVASGVITACPATPTTTLGTSTPVGIFVGCEYIDTVSGLRESNYLPANSVTAGYKSIRVFIEDDPGMYMQVQADGAIAATAIGKNATLTNFGAGSTATGKSAVQLTSASVATTNTLAVRIVDLVNSTSTSGGASVPGDAYTDVIVRWTPGVHAYANATGV